MNARKLLVALLLLLSPALCAQETYIPKTGSIDTNNPLDAGSSAGGGLYEGATMEWMQRAEWVTHVWEFVNQDDMATGAGTTWGTTAIGGGAGAATPYYSYELGVLYIDASTTNTADQGYQIGQTNLQSAADWVDAKAGRTIIYEAIIAMEQWDTASYAVGLVDNLGAGGPVLSSLATWNIFTTDAVVFYNDGNVGGDLGKIECWYEATGGAGDNHVDAGDAKSLPKWPDFEYHRLGIRIEGLRDIKWYVDGVQVCSATAAADLATNMSPYFVVINEDNTVLDNMYIDYLAIGMTR